MKYLNKDLKPLVEAQFPDRGAFLLGEDFGKRAKTTVDNISALKGVQAKKPRYHFSGSGDSNRRSSMPQSRRKTWGASYPRVKSFQQTGLPAKTIKKPEETLQQQTQTKTELSVVKTPSALPSEMSKDPGWQEAVCRPPGLNILKAHQLSEKLHAPLPVGWLAGRTANHFRNWEAITSDKWVLQTVRGYQLEFVNMPTQKQASMTCASKKLSELISQEIEATIQKGAVEEVDPRSSVEGFYSRLFLVPKKDGKHRPVINLRPLNAFLRHQHFKMEGIHVVRDLLQQGDWMARIERCLLRSASVSIRPQIPALQVAEQGLRVHMPSFRVVHSPTSIHQSAQACDYIFEGERNTMCDIPRRHLDHESRQGDTQGGCSLSPNTAGSPGLPGELCQVKSLPSSSAGLSGFGYRLQNQRTEPTPRQAPSDYSRSTASSKTEGGLMQRIGSNIWEDVSSNLGRISCPLALQRLASTQAQGPEKRELRQPDNSLRRCQARSPLVDKQPPGMEWQEDLSRGPSSGDRNRCFSTRMGSFLPWGDDWRELESRRKAPSHQLP